METLLFFARLPQLLSRGDMSQYSFCQSKRLRVGPVNGRSVRIVGEINDFFGINFYFLCPWHCGRLRQETTTLNAYLAVCRLIRFSPHPSAEHQAR